jgi:hypothetical protein
MKRSLASVLAIVFLLLFVLYAGFETIKYFSGPSLEITEPQDLDTIRDSTVTLKGKVARVAYITINGNEAYADTNGNFSAELLLPEGYSIIRITVKDRFGKEVFRDIHLTRLPKTVPEKVVEEEPVATSTEATTTEEDNL